MVSRMLITTVPGFRPDESAMNRSHRVIDQNFQALQDQINRGIVGGSLVAGGSITLEMLAAEVLANSGDVSGTHPAHTVVGIHGSAIAEPASGDDGKAITYTHAGPSFGYTALYSDPLTTRGDLLRRGASASERVALGAANTLLASDGTDPDWSTLTALLDAALGSTRGSVLYRGASGWTILAPGTDTHYLETQGAGADPQWSEVPIPTELPSGVEGDILYHNGTSFVVLNKGSDDEVLTLASGIPSWAAASAGGVAGTDFDLLTDDDGLVLDDGGVIWI